MRADNQETEIKLQVESALAGRALLRSAGFRVSTPRTFESNTILDLPRGALRKARSLLRVRAAGGRGTLTYKGPAIDSKYKSREEIETELPDPEACAAILMRAGLKPVFRYEKYRTEYLADEGGMATLDETPIGVYLELEGSPDWIDRTAARMGFGEGQYITASYAKLFRQWKRKTGSECEHMLFERAPAE